MFNNPLEKPSPWYDLFMIWPLTPFLERLNNIHSPIQFTMKIFSYFGGEEIITWSPKMPHPDYYLHKDSIHYRATCICEIKYILEETWKETLQVNRYSIAKIKKTLYLEREIMNLKRHKFSGYAVLQYLKKVTDRFCRLLIAHKSRHLTTQQSIGIFAQFKLKLLNGISKPESRNTHAA